MLLAKIRDSLPAMPPNFHKIGSYILDHEQNVAFASIYTISQAVGLSNASLVRFAKSLGLDGYQALKREVQDEIKHRLGPYDKIALQELDSLPEEKRLQKLYMSEINNLRNTFDKIQPRTIETMAENLRTARRIFVCGFGVSGYLARAFEYTLISSINKEVTLITGSVSDYAPHLRGFGAEDVMFIMTFPPYSEEIRHVAQVVKDSGGRLNLFTNSASCPIYHLAHSIVRCDTNSLLLTNSYVGLVSILNILVHLVFLGTQDKSIEVRKQSLAMQEDGYSEISKGR